MTTKFSTTSKILGGAIAAAALALPASALAEETVNWQIGLKHGSAYPTATGAAQYQAQPGQREFQVEVEHILALKGKSVSVCVNGAQVGMAKVSLLGKADLTRNTEIGQAVPAIVHGSSVSVTTAPGCTGQLVASGQF